MIINSKKEMNIFTTRPHILRIFKSFSLPAVIGQEAGNMADRSPVCDRPTLTAKRHLWPLDKLPQISVPCLAVLSDCCLTDNKSNVTVFCI